MYGEETDLSSDHSNEARGRFRRIEAVKGRAISSFESFNKSVERNEEQEESKSRFELSFPGNILAASRQERNLCRNGRSRPREESSSRREGWASTGVKGVSGCIQKREKRLERVARRG